MIELRNLRTFVLALMLVLSGPAATSATEPVLSPADETRLGDAIAMRIAAQGILIERPELNELLLGLAGASDATDAPWIWRVHLLRSAGITSFDTVGGHVYISRGLIFACADGAQLRAALAHQMAHATARDTLRRITAGYGAGRTLALARGESPEILDGIAANLAASGTLARHGENAELAADAETLRRGASPTALHELLSLVSSRKLSARYVDVHPVTRRRMAALAALPIAVDASPAVVEAFGRLRALLAHS